MEAKLSAVIKFSSTRTFMIHASAVLVPYKAPPDYEAHVTQWPNCGITMSGDAQGPYLVPQVYNVKGVDEYFGKIARPVKWHLLIFEI